MNVPEEHARLRGKDLMLEGQRYPQRLKNYAQGVFLGLQKSAQALWEGRTAGAKTPGEASTR